MQFFRITYMYALLCGHLMMYFSLQIPFLLSELCFEHAVYMYEFQGCQNSQNKEKNGLHPYIESG